MNQPLDSTTFTGLYTIPIPLLQFLLNLLGAALLSLILGRFYIKLGRSLSNRKGFAENFLLISTTTMLIISIVKSSLALSLGLVGALSIVRFRAAIKEPEELAFLFLAIAIGLGFGANQYAVTLIAFFTIIGLLWGRERLRKKVPSDHNLVVCLRAETTKSVDFKKVSEILKSHCRAVSLRRLEEGRSSCEALFAVEMSAFEDLLEAKTQLRALDEHIEVSFVDQKYLP